MLRNSRVLGLIAPGFALLVAGCGLKAPAQPQWSVTLRVPLVARGVSVSDLVAHNSGYLSVDSTGTAALHWSQDLDPTPVGDALSLGPVHSGATAPMGQFEVSPAAPVAIQITLADIWPQAGTLNGQLSDIPGLTFAPIRQTQVSGFQTAVVAGGTLTVGLANHLPVGIGPSTLQLSNAVSGGPVGALQFSALAPGESTSTELNLEGATVSSSWIGAWSGSSPGSPGPVMVDASSSLRTTFAFAGPLTVQSASAPVPAQQLHWSSSLALPDTEQLASADFSAGNLNLTLHNPWAVAGSLQLTLPDFTTGAGSPLAAQLQISGAGAFQISLPLAGAHFAASDAQHAAVRVSGDFQTPGSAAALTLSASDLVTVDADLAGARFSRVQGKFAPFRVELAPLDRALDLPSGLGPIGLAAAGGRLTVNSTAGVPAHVTLGVTGVDAQGASWALTSIGGGPLQLDVPAAGPGGASGALVLDGGNSNLPEFLGHLPRRITVSSYADVGDRDQTASVGSSDHFDGHFELSSALLASFSDSRISLDPDSTRISADTRDRIRDRLTRVRVHARVTNGLPLGADASLVLAGSRAEAQNPGSGAVTLSASTAAGQVDAASGAVTAPTASDVTLELTGAQLDVFQHDPLFLGMQVHLPGTAGHAVRVRAQDAVRAQVWLEVEGKVNR